MTGPGPVAIIGCGEMGRPIAIRLLKAGLSVVACDTNPTRTAPLADLGARVTGDLVEATRAAACALVLVNTEAQVRAVLEGIAPHRTPQMPIAIMSTISPAGMRDLSRHHACLVDAPLSGGPIRAEEGQLTILLGGAATDIDRFRPVLAPLASHILICGQVGAAQAAKVVNNILCHANTVLMAEALALGRSEGLNFEVLRQVMDVSTGRNYLTATSGAAERLYAGFTTEAASFQAILGILRKDIDIATSMARNKGQTLPGLTALSALLENLGEETFSTWSKVAGR